MDSRLQLKHIEEERKLNQSIVLLNETDREKEKLYQVYRGLFLSLIVIVLFLNTIYGFAIINGDIACITDFTFPLTEKLNHFLLENTETKKKLIIFSSLVIDIMVISFGFIWTSKGDSWRPIVSMIFFYALKMTAQLLLKIKFPDGYTWENPGIPSLVVPYAKSNNLYFSGQIGIPVIIGFEFDRMGMKIPMVLCLVITAMESIVLLAMRANYIIDILSGILIAHYTFLMSERYIYIIDDSCLSMKIRMEELDSKTC